MNLLKYFCALACLTLSFSLSAAAQEKPAGSATEQPATAPSAESKPVAASQPASEDAAPIIYFYRIKQFAGSALEPSVYCDGKELARMDNGRYFGVRLTPGKHTCNMGDKQTGFEIDVKNGQSYYAKINIEMGVWKGHGRLTLLQPEQGAFEIKKAKPLGLDKVKDRSQVTVYEGSDKKEGEKAK
jgi:hypothetical protein